jgi:hypothetical protein
MRLGLAACALALCALPASGSNPQIDPRLILPLTLVDSAPEASGLNGAFASPDAALAALRATALEPSNLGLQIRAIRALPSYCPKTPPGCGPGTIMHDTLSQLIGTYQAPRDAKDLLRLRAAVEALGATHVVLDDDVTLLVPLLSHASRDVRATVARALRGSCSVTAKNALKTLDLSEPSAQVQVAILSALQVLEQCARDAP